MKDIEFIQVTAENAGHYAAGFAHVFEKAFEREPYCETYEPGQVENDILQPSLADGFVVVAVLNNQVVGLGCAVPVSKASADVQQYLSEKRDEGVLPIALEKTWYMSEVGVLIEHCRKGIGTELLRQRLQLISSAGGEHYIMRTSKEGSNSVGMYRRAGAIELPGFQDVSTSDQVTVNQSQSQHRIYLYGSCDTAAFAPAL